MPERLVDVEKKGAEVLLTFPVTISGPDVEEETFKEKAAKMHVSRGGQLIPYGDPHGVLATAAWDGRL
jgi:hypothetical protein